MEVDQLTLTEVESKAPDEGREGDGESCTVKILAELRDMLRRRPLQH